MKKTISAIAALTLAAGMLFAGGKKEADTSSGPVTLKWALWDYTQTVYYKPLIEAFEATHPNIKIEPLDLGSSDYQTMLSTQLTGGDSSIDVVTVKDIPGYATLVKAGQLVDLTPLMKKNNINPADYNGAAEQMTVDGKLYEMPFRSDFRVVFYNKDLFDKAGVPYPKNDWTWDEYDALARKMTSGSGASKVYGSHYHTWRSMVQCQAILDGHTVVQPPYDFMKPYYERVLKQQKEGICMDYAQLKTTSTHYSGVFYNNSVAMMEMGSWFISTLGSQIAQGKTEVKNWGIVKLPHAAGVKAGTTVGTLTGVGISSASKHQKESAEFVAFLCGEKGAEVLANTGNYPALMNSKMAEILAARPGFPQDANSKAALQTEKICLEIAYSDKAPQIDAALNRAHDNIMTLNTTLDEGLAQADKEVKGILAR
ncbi:MAG: sugar ABC transporter substrate-binding protein [Treponema sp.]|nr:sugar ABC transporter substrate-binding protein [Treponema sp.]